MSDDELDDGPSYARPSNTHNGFAVSDDAKFGAHDDDEDDDSDVENYLPQYRRRKQPGPSEAESKPLTQTGAGGLGNTVKADDSDEDDDSEAPEAKSSSAPSKPPPRTGAPAVAQSKETADDEINDFGCAKIDKNGKLVARPGMSMRAADGEGAVASVDQLRNRMIQCAARGGDTAATHVMQECFIVRDRSGSNMMSPVYRLYRDVAASADGRRDRSKATFLMSARKQPFKGSSYFLISLDTSPTDRTSDGVVGKLRGAGWSGGQYVIYDHGLNPQKATNPRTFRRELGFIQFEYDQMGPGTLRALVPAVTPSGVMDVWRPEEPEQTIAAAARRRSC